MKLLYLICLMKMFETIKSLAFDLKFCLVPNGKSFLRLSQGMHLTNGTKSRLSCLGKNTDFIVLKFLLEKDGIQIFTGICNSCNVIIVQDLKREKHCIMHKFKWVKYDLIRIYKTVELECIPDEFVPVDISNPRIG